MASRKLRDGDLSGADDAVSRLVRVHARAQVREALRARLIHVS